MIASWVETIRAEAIALHEPSKIRGAGALNDIGFNSFFRRGWRRFYLKWYDRPHPSAVALCPNTLSILQNIPTVKAAMFAMLPPDGVLTLHSESIRRIAALSPGTRDADRRKLRDHRRRRALFMARRRRSRFRRNLSALGRKQDRQKPHHPILRHRTTDEIPVGSGVQPLGRRLLDARGYRRMRLVTVPAA